MTHDEIQEFIRQKFQEIVETGDKSVRLTPEPFGLRDVSELYRLLLEVQDDDREGRGFAYVDVQYHTSHPRVVQLELKADTPRPPGFGR